jgi:hypothetical protein
VLRLRTSGSVVYVCTDAGGNLYYDANRGGDDAPWIPGQTELFLPGVVRGGDGDYHARAGDGATFAVNRARLLVVHPDGRREIQQAVG